MATPENQDTERVKTLNNDLEMTSDSASNLLLPKKKSKWESEDSDSEGSKQHRKKRKRDKRTSKALDLQPSTHTASSSPCSEDIISTSPSTPPPPVRLVVRPPPPLKAPTLSGCRHVDNYEKLNRIEEGAYGVVFRAKDKATGDIVALKKLKLDKEKNGFPITSLREIHTLMLCKHPNIVNVREIVVGDKQDQIFIVMDFVEHDLKSLMEDMHTPFLQSEVKTIMLQLLSAIALMHNNWMIHRDLKTSNLLLNNRGEIKVADFGLARKYGSPLGPMTGLVVTLWYRAPELLLGTKEYSTSVDMWSIGCIFGELVNKEPLFPGQSEIDQMNKIFKLLGVPNEKIWPGVSNLPNFRSISWADMPYNNLRSRFPYLTENGLNLLSRLLNYDPQKRITAEEALKHAYFFESPAPKDPSLFPTWPSKGSGEKKKQFVSPSAPQVAHAGQEIDDDDALLHGSIFDQHATGEGAAGFRLKLM